MIWQLESRFWTQFMLTILYHVMYLLAINPYSLGSISAFSIISSILDLAHLTSTPTSTGIYPIQSLSPHYSYHAHRQSYGSLTLFVCCLRPISASSIASIRVLAPDNVIDHAFLSFTMTKADHSEGGRVTKSMGSSQPKKVAKRTVDRAKSHGRSIHCGTRTIRLTNFAGQMPHYATHAPAAFTKSSGDQDAAA